MNIRQCIGIFLLFLGTIGVSFGQTAFLTNSGNTIGIQSGAVFYVGGGISNTGASGVILNEGALFSKGNITHASVSVYAGNGTLYVTGSSVQMLDFSGTTIGNLVIANSTYAQLAADLIVSTSLTFTNGYLNAGAFMLTIGSTGTVSGAGTWKFVVGNLRKYYDIAVVTSSATFEVGSAVSGAYLPLTATFANVRQVSTIFVKINEGKHADIATTSPRLNSNKGVNYTWTLDANNMVADSYDVHFQYPTTAYDATSNPLNFKMQRYFGGWTAETISSASATSLTATGLADMGDMQIAEILAAGITSMTPFTTTASLNGFELTINGTDFFTTTATMDILASNGTTAATMDLMPYLTSQSGTQLKFAVPAGLVSTIGTMSVQVQSDGYGATTTLTVTNDTPTISTSQTAHSFNEDGTTTLTVTISDVVTPVASLVVTATSSNLSLVTNAGITQVGVTGATTQLLITPLPDANGTVTITVRVSDGSLSSTTTFTLTVNPVNDPEIIATGATVFSINEDATTTLTASIASVDGFSGVTVTATSSNTSLVSNSGLVQSGATGATTNFVLTPVTNANGGPVTISLTVSDGSLSSTTTFTITINPVADISSLSPVRNTTASLKSADIVLTWDMTMNALTSGNIVVRGSQTGAYYSTNGSLGTVGSVVTVNPATDFKAGELISVSVTGATGSGAGQATDSFTYSFLAAAGLGTGGFAHVTNQNVGAPIYSAALGDFNNDGNLDFITASYSADQVSVRLGDGSGAFSSMVNVTVGHSPYAIVSGDFNGDGNLDFATANYDVASVSIGLGNGNGGFTTTADVAVQTGPRGLSVGDFNGDGQLDLAVANYTSGSISILLGNGTGGFSAANNISLGGYPYTVSVGDFNNDGKLDFAAGNANGNAVFIRLGDGRGGFSSTANLTVQNSPRSIAVADMNNDGNLDLVTANYTSNSVSVCLGNGTGGFSVSTNASAGAGSGPYFVSVGDFTGDGKVDFVTANYGSYDMTIGINDGFGNYTTSALAQVPTYYTQVAMVATGDFNNDRLLDIAVAGRQANGSVSIFSGILANDPPVISTSAIAVAFNEEGSTTITVTISDTETATTALVLTATSSNVSIIANASIVQVGSTGATTQFTLTSVTNANGSVNIRVTVSDGYATSSTTFTVTVNAVNDPETISTTATAITINEDQTTTLSVSIGSVDGFSGVIVTATSSNTSLVANSGLVLQGATGATTNFLLTPVTNANGSALITLMVSDGEYSATTTFSVTVNAVNDVPTFTTGANVTVNEGSGAYDAAFATGMDDGDPELTQTLTFWTSNNNNALFMVQPVISVTTGNLSFTPAASGNGLVTVTVGLSDDGGTANGGVNTTATKTFIININARPTIATTATAIIINEDNTTTLSVSVADTDTPLGSLTVTATSSNIALIPNGNLTATATTGSTRQFLVTPVTNANGGPVTITLTVSDGSLSATTTFSVTVNAVNDIPTFSTGANVTVAEDSGAYDAAFATGINDGDPELTQTLTFWVSNDNTALFAVQPSIAVTSGNLTFTPATNANGVATVTVGLSDDGGTANGGVNTTATKTFVITITPVNDMPTITSTGAHVSPPGQSTTAYFSVYDVETAAGSLIVSVTSSDLAVVPVTGISVTTSGSLRTVVVTSAGGGTCLMTVTVSDGSLSTTTTFYLSSNIAPVVTASTVSIVKLVNSPSISSNATFTLQLSDDLTPVGQLVVTVTSSNLTLVTNAGITQVGATGATTSFSVSQQLYQYGTTALIIRVTDQYGAEGTTTITLSVQNPPPVITTSNTAITMCKNGTQLLTYYISDYETLSNRLIITATSSNLTVIPNNRLVQAQPTAATQTLNAQLSGFYVVPTPGQTGVGTVTITAQDWCGSQSTTTFTITVKELPSNSISGNASVCASASTAYSVPSTTGGVYVWSAVGGSVSGGQGTTQATITWGGTGSGSVSVNITDTIGCATTNSLSVTIGGTLAMVGNAVSQPSTTQTYSVSSISGASYVWSAVGGTIQGSTTGTSAVVLWGAGTSGSVTAMANLTGGCTVYATTAVIIQGPPTVGDGLVAWWKASTVTGANATLLPYSSPYGPANPMWSDASGSGNGAYLPALKGGNAPTYFAGTSANAINGNPVVRFNGAQGLVVATSASVNTGASKTAFVAFRTGNDVNTMQVVFESGQSGGTNQGYNITLFNGRIYFGLWSGTTAKFLSYPVATNTVYVAQFMFDGGLSGAFKASVNGVEAGTETTYISAITQVLAANANGIGTCYAGTRYVNGYVTTSFTERLYGDIGEILILNSVNSAVRNNAHQYLTTKYGVTPTDSPFDVLNEWKVEDGADVNLDEVPFAGANVHLLVTPNPVQDEAKIGIKAEQTSAVEITVYDMLGRKVLPTQNAEVREGWNSFSLQTQTIPSGTYRVVVSGGSVQESAVMVIVK